MENRTFAPDEQMIHFPWCLSKKYISRVSRAAYYADLTQYRPVTANCEISFTFLYIYRAKVAIINNASILGFPIVMVVQIVSIK